MSISTTIRLAGPYAGNGVQTVFAYAFKVFATTDLVVTKADTAGVETILALGVGYTATMNGNQDTAPGGDITLLVPLATGEKLTITTDVPQLQGVTVTNAGGFFPTVFNNVFDKLTIFCQQLAEKLGRSLKLPITASGVSPNVPVQALAILQWDAGGTALQALTLPDLSLSLALPAQAGHSGEFLTTNGVIASWGDAVAPTRSISAGGLATGGGTLGADRTITVTGASQAQVRAGSSSAVAVVPATMWSSAAFITLTDAATVAWDASQGFNARVTLGGNRTIGAPTNLVDGITYTLEVVQDATGSRVPSWNAIWDWGAAGAPVLQTAAGKRDKVYAQYNAATGKLDASFRKGA